MKDGRTHLVNNMFGWNKSKSKPDSIQRLIEEVGELRKSIESFTGKKTHQDEIRSGPKVGSSTNDQIKKGSPSPSSLTQANECEVMISLNCATMLTTAQRFKSFLERHGVKVWLCVNMNAGVDFRDEIIAAVDSCKIFVPLINEAWCKSKECKFEFNYGFRKNLTSSNDMPAIVPICFPDLQWNAHGHVRALLANTNALIYKPDAEEDVLDTLKVSLESTGFVQMKSHDVPSKWSSNDVVQFLHQILIEEPFQQEEKVDGKTLLSMDAAVFQEKVLRAAKSAKKKAEELHLKHSAELNNLELIESVAAEPTCKIAGESPLQFSYDGMYKVIAKTTNCEDGNVTKSNTFLVTLQRNGLSSSGCAWNAGSMHNNYDGVTAVWQGEYHNTDGQFFFSSVYSNDTMEQYAGQFEKCGDDNRFLYCRGKYTKYAWYGYGRQSFGMMDMFFYKLSKKEMMTVKESIQELALEAPGATPLETVMRNIGPEMKWSDFHQVADFHPAIEVDPRGFCAVPSYNSFRCAGMNIALQFQLPSMRISIHNHECVVSIVRQGATDPDYNYYVSVSESILARGYVFPKGCVPDQAGKYEIAFFLDGKKMASNPITLVEPNLWRKAYL